MNDFRLLESNPSHYLLLSHIQSEFLRKSLLGRDTCTGKYHALTQWIFMTFMGRVMWQWASSWPSLMYYAYDARGIILWKSLEDLQVLCQRMHQSSVGFSENGIFCQKNPSVIAWSFLIMQFAKLNHHGVKLPFCLLRRSFANDHRHGGISTAECTRGGEFCCLAVCKKLAE